MSDFCPRGHDRSEYLQECLRSKSEKDVSIGEGLTGTITMHALLSNSIQYTDYHNKKRKAFFNCEIRKVTD